MNVSFRKKHRFRNLTNIFHMFPSDLIFIIRTKRRSDRPQSVEIRGTFWTASEVEHPEPSVGRTETVPEFYSVQFPVRGARTKTAGKLYLRDLLSTRNIRNSVFMSPRHDLALMSVQKPHEQDPIPRPPPPTVPPPYPSTTPPRLLFGSFS